MADYETSYQALGSACDEDEEAPPGENIVHVVTGNSRARWNHIEDLDEFFTRVYQYHQRNGFFCMVLQDVLQILQFLFVVLFSTFLIKCVNYDVLFDEVPSNHTHKVTLPEAVIPIDQCVDGFGGAIITCLSIALLFWFFRVIKFIYNLLKYLEIRSFYGQALKITAGDLANMTWHEVQHRLLEVQQEQQMCIHKRELSELDIYHRILRFKNYLIAMVNKSMLPLKFTVPFIGEYTFLTTGLKYNIEMILFWGPWSPFENNWHLKKDYKTHHKRKQLAEQLSKQILWLGIANLLLSPLIFLWQILYSFFRYAEIFKREPALMGSRKWSLSGRVYLRHFNELDHEFDARLNRAYRPGMKYMNIFTSPVLVILAKHLAFFAGSILAVLVILTIVDEDTLAVKNVIATITVLSVVLTIASACIPDEHLVFCPELMMRHILAEIHYMPDSWKGNAHTFKVRKEFSALFQYKIVYLLEELFSPLVTPFVLVFPVRRKALEIVDFYRNFTVEVTGVGDVCSFAQMDIRKHGHPQWVDEAVTEADNYQQAEHGKTELSLMHFTLTNPKWRPPETEGVFINRLRGQAQQDATLMSVMPGHDNALYNSLHSLSSGGYHGYNSMVTSLLSQGMGQGVQPRPVATEGATGGGLPPAHSGAPESMAPLQHSASHGTSVTMTTRAPGLAVRGGLRHAEGPVGGGNNGLLASLSQVGGWGGPPGGMGMGAGAGAGAGGGGSGVWGLPSLPPLDMPSTPFPQLQAHKPRGFYDEETLEFHSAEMSFSALYMHQLHQRRMFQPLFDSSDDFQETSVRGAYAQPHSAHLFNFRLDDDATTPQTPPGPASAPGSLRAQTADSTESMQTPGMGPRMPNIQEHAEDDEEEEEEEVNNENQPLIVMGASGAAAMYASESVAKSS